MISPTHLERQPLSSRGLDRLYPLPNETRSLDDAYRLRHLDLPHLGDLDLDRERFRLSACIAFEPDRLGRGWLVERRDAVLAEQHRRAADRR